MMQPVYDTFRSLSRDPDERIDLARAALQLARVENPRLDLDTCLRRLDGLADTVRARVPPGAASSQLTGALHEVLFSEQGFRGNREQYEDPRNSCLDQVLERRLGIPITLSLVYMEVARRLDLEVHGIGFPSHFLVRVRDERGTRVIDAFDRGTTLSEGELDRRLRELFGDKAPRIRSNPGLLRRATSREILIRMCRNLKAIYLKTGQYARALEVINAILHVVSDLADEILERGLVYRELEYTPAAIEDLRRYLELAPDARDATAVSSLIADLEEKRPLRLH